ncbi:MAG: aldo/keto reductase [Planctomycetota bacterium]|jgi:aryl-alcohol dehydrogenase-like predicted oxidoreductase
MQPQELDRREFIKGVAAGAVGLGLTGATARHVFAQDKEARAGQLKTNVLGRTGIESSVIIYGGVPLRPEHLRLLQIARERGVNTYDVAWGYGGGQAEVAIGGLLEATKHREKLHLITKASGYRPPGGSARSVHADLKARVTSSLKRMRTEYVDVFMWPHGTSSLAFLDHKPMRDALRKLKDEKLIRHIGVSTHSNYVRVGEAAVKDGFYDVVLSVFNVCTQKASRAGPIRGRRGGRLAEDTRKLAEMAKRKNVALLAMKCANGGFLSPNTDELLKGEFPPDSPLSRHQKLYDFCLKQEGVSAVVLGIRSALHLQEALEMAKA